MNKLILLVVVSFPTFAVSAQQPDTRSGHALVHHYDPSQLATVGLMGEDSVDVTQGGRRLAKLRVEVCTGIGAIPEKLVSLAFPAVVAAKGTVAVPAHWHLRTVKFDDAPVTVGDWTVLAAFLTDTVGLRADLRPHASVFYGSEDGFPTVRLVQGSSVRDRTECQIPLASGQIAHVAQAVVKTPRGESVTYILGYAPVGNGLWGSFVSSSSRVADTSLLRAVFRSIMIEPSGA